MINNGTQDKTTTYFEVKDNHRIHSKNTAPATRKNAFFY